MLPCLYCESAAGDLRQALVHQDRDVVAFLDWRQSAPGHVLVLPRHHLSAAELFSGPVGGALMAVTMRVAQAVQRIGGADGVQMGALLYPGQAAATRASGRARHPGEPPIETAEDGHFHLHVLVRQHGGELARIYPFGDEIGAPEELEAIAARLRSALLQTVDTPRELGRALRPFGA